MLDPLSFTLDTFFTDGSWHYLVYSGKTHITGKAPSRGSALQEGYKKLMEVIRSTINE